jgi:hypothetical protein
VLILYFAHQITRELARQNPLVLEQVHATEQSLPAAATVVGLFLASTFLDRNFLLAIASAFQSQLSPEQASGIWHGRAATDEIFKRAFWSEFQVSKRRTNPEVKLNNWINYKCPKNYFFFAQDVMSFSQSLFSYGLDFRLFPNLFFTYSNHPRAIF